MRFRTGEAIMKYRTYFSDRNIPLVYCGPPPEKPLLTIENYCKWYWVYVVMPDGSVETPTDRILTDDELAEYSDHIPSPKFCQTIAKKLGYNWDRQSLEMIAGRAVTELDSNQTDGPSWKLVVFEWAQ
jgi:hypothetical protein